ncbi:HET domain-containing protein [Colletotrichum kahawae]|uniref:HET domain-containing protein n=1 Tax=Colletotrichum kahawae TaxID=34407 RepID=A0AAD9YDS6_COLKA|nr:HET domain-containing protein [Colletotrichum kahawae]
MGEIYKCAETVHVWLGHVDADEVAIAFANVRMVYASPATESYKAEIRLADRAVLRYGEHSVEYARFRAAWYLVESRMLSQDDQKDLRPLLKRDVTYDFSELLWGFHMANCSDPRDSLAALYGFLPQSKQPIDIQYGQIGWKEMYHRLAERLINENTLSANRVILHLFAFGPAATQSLDDSKCPSWVPDWSAARQLGMASGEFSMDLQNSVDRADKPWIDCSNELGGSKTEGPSSNSHLNGSLSGKEKEELWLQEARQDIPLGSRKYRSLKIQYATRFSAGQNKLRARWSPIRGGLYGKSARLILKLPREVVTGEKLWELALSCLKPIQHRKNCQRIAALFAIILRGMDIGSDHRGWPLDMLKAKLYKAFKIGFENPGFLVRGQVHLLTLIGSILRKFAFVELHPLWYSLDDDPMDPISLEEYGLAPYDMELGDILIPCDETRIQNLSNKEWFEPVDGCHLVEVPMCLRPISPKKVYEVLNVFQTKLPSPLNKIATRVFSSKRTYRDLQKNQEFSFPPSQVRTARFLGPVYCVSAYRTTIWENEDSNDYFEYFCEERLVTKLREDYRDARAAGLCRPLHIDIV